MSMALTRRQEELLTFLTIYRDTNPNISPTYEEMMEAVGVSSKSAIHRYICALELRGRIRRIKGHARAIEVVDEHADPLRNCSLAVLVAEIERRGLICNVMRRFAA